MVSFIFRTSKFMDVYDNTSNLKRLLSFKILVYVKIDFLNKQDIQNNANPFKQLILPSRMYQKEKQR